MIGFNIFLLSLLLITPLFVKLFWLFGEGSIFIKIIKTVVFSIFMSIIPAIVVAWGLRSILPNVYEIGNNRDDSWEKYKFFYDFESNTSLSLCTDYITNAGDEDVYLIRVFYLKHPVNSWDERKPSELIAIIPPKTTIECPYYIGHIYPKQIFKNYSKTTGSRKRRRHVQITEEVMVVSKDLYEKERNRTSYY